MSEDGRVRGVETNQDEFIPADAIVSNYNGIGTYLEMLSDTPAPHARGSGTLRELRLRSPDSSRTLRSIYIYRPGGVTDTAKLPVLYLLHGLPGSAGDIWTGFDGKKLLDTEFTHGAAPYEVVTLDGHGTKHRDTEWADSADGADEVESFVLNVAIPAVEGAHRRDACHRAIAGFSMGGFGAMNLAQRHPDVFGQVAAVAGYFHLDDPDAVFGTTEYGERFATIIGRDAVFGVQFHPEKSSLIGLRMLHGFVGICAGVAGARA